MPFSVTDFHDLLRLLEERPDWRAELRRVVLTDDLLRLPEDLARARQETDERFRDLARQIAALTGRVDALTERLEVLTGRVDALTERLEVLTGRVDALAEGLEVLTRRVDALVGQVGALTGRLDVLTAQVSIIAGHVGTLRGESLENRYRTRAYAYFGRILRGAHALTSDELAALLDPAIESGALADRDAQEVALADLVVRGRRQPDGALVYLVVEVSVGAGIDDVRRAVDRAELLTRAGVAAVPAVAGEWITPDALDAARGLRVWQITDGRIVTS
jgi:polyhydroxyalkanoate synthesis regulator phasin